MHLGRINNVNASIPARFIYFKTTIQLKLQDDNKLDNPVWFSLSECHNKFVIDYGTIKFYHPDFCPFGGFVKGSDTSSHIDEYSKLATDFFIVGQKPELSHQVKLKGEVVCLQMIINEGIDLELNETIVKLTGQHFDALFNLINLVQPGYFKKKTASLGCYFGIFKNGDLIAVTGERMKMNDFIEISAVITHPGHIGKGYAMQLVAHTANNILARDKTPYLHVVEKIQVQ